MANAVCQSNVDPVQMDTIRSMSPRLKIKPIGNMGNQMLQYMVALSIQRRLGDLDISGHNIPNWNISAPSPADFSNRPLRLGGHLIDADQIVRILASERVRDVLFHALGFRLRNLETPDFYRKIFRTDIDVAGYGPGHVVINVRGAEILGRKHKYYRPLPFSYFDTVIENSGAHPVFMGQLGDDPYSERLRIRYPQAMFLPSQGPLKDFEILRRSHEISVSVSTFSWLAAWLSEAKTIHYPVCGMLDPILRPDIDLLPLHDDRYIFYSFRSRKWAATNGDFEDLWRPGRNCTIGLADLETIRLRADRMVLAHRALHSMKVEFRSLIPALR